MATKIQKKQLQPVKGRSKFRTFITKPIPLYFFILLFFPLFTIAIHFYKPSFTKKIPVPTIKGNYIEAEHCASIVRESKNNLIAPLLFVEINDDQMLTPIKTQVINFIEHNKQEGKITSASVYLNDLNTGTHFEINPDELYDPASIMKVSLMLSYLKKAESNPDLLNKRYAFSKPSCDNFKANVKDKTLEIGKNYSVAELLEFMITYSDNEAFLILIENYGNFDFNILNNEFDIPILTGDKFNLSKRRNFVANVNSMSRFFRVLYSATFLNRDMSQYALKLLSKSNYRNGILQGIDPSVTVAHKFGERIENGVAQLHEFGIVYLQNRPYLIGVMTKGNDLSQLPEVLSGISAIAYREFSAMK
jgi:beta-lactamase class A